MHGEQNCDYNIYISTSSLEVPAPFLFHKVKSATELASRGLLVDEVEAMAVVGLLQFVDILQSSMKSALKEDLYWCAATLSFFNKQLFGVSFNFIIIVIISIALFQLFGSAL
ncbi:uncharacterized protein LOC131225826 isoform X4 [Magnolia sinica]|uniref:uncharacterized protein LOC131225826 isoform X4 n=1 Tax=Magnolia sinica TaxID=86752 RepID=UPI002657D8E2|nr:uncharacterized protein LOC131225826 isoform X4 [Magnolia sinica]